MKTEGNIVSFIIDELNFFKKLKVENIFAFLEDQNIEHTNEYVYEILSLLRRNGYIEVLSEKKNTNQNSTITLIKKIPKDINTRSLRNSLKEKRDRNFLNLCYNALKMWYKTN